MTVSVAAVALTEQNNPGREQESKALEGEVETTMWKPLLNAVRSGEEGGCGFIVDIRS